MSGQVGVAFFHFKLKAHLRLKQLHGEAHSSRRTEGALINDKQVVDVDEASDA